MNSKIVITPFQKNNTAGILSVLYEDDKCVEIHFEPRNTEKLIGNIYIGKVKNIVPNINAAFIEIAPGTACYYNIGDHKNPCFTQERNTDKKLVAGDELLVQVSKEGIKTKAPVVTSNLNFPGKYVVLTSGNSRIGISGKIGDRRRQELKELLRQRSSTSYGFVIRTNAEYASDEDILNEAEHLCRQYERIRDTAAHRTCYSQLYKEPASYLNYIRDIRNADQKDIITDDNDIYNEVRAFIDLTEPDRKTTLSLYEDPKYPLIKLYSLETELERALQERVWLKSGAYLVIQHTEAFHVIDVNSGKFTGKKDIQETFFKINKEAAGEIARQMRLRNLSGIILVDFIDLKDKEMQEQLLTCFRHELKKDPLKVNLIDITALNIAELTRKKADKPLRELLPDYILE